MREMVNQYTKGYKVRCRSCGFKFSGKVGRPVYEIGYSECFICDHCLTELIKIKKELDKTDESDTTVLVSGEGE